MLNVADLRARFFSKLRTCADSDCILWDAAKRDAGYGLLSVDGVLKSATHVSWFLKHGDWPTLKVLHRCDNPPCVNPDHLFEGTDADNAADRDAKGRHRVLSGADAPWTKLAYLEVREIIALTETRMSLKEIGKLFDVGAAYVSSLRSGRYRPDAVREKLPPKPHADKSRIFVEIGGRRLSIKEVAREAGVGEETIRQRMKEGLTGAALLAGKHKAPRKPYIRRR